MATEIIIMRYNKEEKRFYKEANSTGIADSFKTIFEDIKTSIAATNVY